MSDVISTALNQTKLSAAELAYLQSFLNAGDRGGFYMAYYAMVAADDSILFAPSPVGKDEASLQTKVATFSGPTGAIAFLSNRILQEAHPVNGTGEEYIGIYRLSQEVAQAALDAMVSTRQQGGTGLINDARFFETTNAAWQARDLFEVFPGRLIDSGAPTALARAISAFTQYVGYLVGEVGSENGVTRQEMLNWMTDDGFRVGALTTFYVAARGVPGKQLSDFPGHTILTSADGGQRYVVNAQGKVLAAESVSNLGAGTSQLETMSNIAGPALDVLFAVGSAIYPLLTQLGVLTKEAFFALYVDPVFQPHLPSSWASLSYPVGEGAPALDPPSGVPSTPHQANGSGDGETISGGSGGVVFGGSDTIDAGGGDDAIFGGGGDDTLKGGEGDDIIWAHEEEDTLEGGKGDDILRGGEDNDTLRPGEGDDIVDGGEPGLALAAGGRDTVEYNDLQGGDFIDVRLGDLSDEEMDAGVFRVSEPNGMDTLISIERVIGTDASDIISIIKFDEDQLRNIEYIDLKAHSGRVVDTISASDAPSGVYFDLRNSESQEVRQLGASFALTVKNAEGVNGSAFDDIILGVSDRSNALYGGDGADIIRGGSQGDHLRGNDDDGDADQLEGKEGGDLFGLGPNDVILDVDREDRVYYVTPEESGPAMMMSAAAAEEEEVEAGTLLTGGERDGAPSNPCVPTISSPDDDPPSGSYEGDDDLVYAYDKPTASLTVSKDGDSITIKQFRNGDAGIRLAENRPQQQQAECNRDPLIIDLDRNREVVEELFDSSAYFDLDNDGFAEHVAWALRQDGLLALDRDGDGLITSGAELFGTGHSELHGSTYATKGTDGFGELQLLDTNGDFAITAADVQFGELRVWIDANGDAVTDEGELRTVAELGIVSISLVRQKSDDTDCGCDGTDIPYMSSVAFDDGSSTGIYDAYLSIDQYDTREVGPVAVSAEAAALPFVLGTGNLSDLDVAMSRDPALLEMVQAFAALDLSQVGEVFERVEQILLRWTGADQVAADSRGPSMNARWLTAIETVSGSGFIQANVGTSPRADAGAILTGEWHELVGRVAAQLIGQTQLGATLFVGLSFEAGAFFSVDSGTTLESVLASIAGHAPADLIDAVAYWHVSLNTIERYASELGVNVANILAAADQLLATAGVALSAADIMGASIAGESSALLTGTQGVWVQVGQDNFRTDGRDVIVALPGVSEIDGRGGNADLILVTREAGEILVRSAGGRDSTLWLTDVDPEELDFDVEVAEQGLNIVVTTLAGDFRAQFSFHYSLWSISTEIENIRFSDGSQVAVMEALIGRSLELPDGRLLVIGAGAGGEIVGGAFGDELIGVTAADTYRVGPTRGSDNVYDKQTDGVSTDQLIVEAPLADVTFAWSTTDPSALVLAFAGSDARVTISGQRSESGSVIESFAFSDGTILSVGDVDRIVATGGGGADNLEGSARPTIFEGGGGDDLLQGMTAADTYIFGLGDGHDRILDPGEMNVIQFADGIDASDLHFSRGGHDRNDFVVRIGAGDDSITIEGGLFNRTVETFRFADGSELAFHDAIAGLALPEEGFLFGTSRDDFLQGTVFEETFDGLGGDDQLSGQSGSDSYVFGQGRDRIQEGDDPGTDAIFVPHGFILADLRIDYNDFNQHILWFQSHDASIEYRAARPGSGTGVEQIRFADGRVFDLAQGIATQGTAGDDILYHFQFASADFHPGAGDDLIFAVGGNDGIGQTRYWLESGFGHDLIVDAGGSQDTIIFAEVGLTADDVDFLLEGFDLVLRIRATGDSVRVVDQFHPDNGNVGFFNNRAVDLVEFTGGTQLDRNQIAARIGSPTPGNDVIVGGATLDGGAGDDLLVGDAAANTYVFAQGHGDDRISERGPDGAAIDILQLDGLSPEDVRFVRSESDPFEIVMTVLATGETLTIDLMPFDDDDWQGAYDLFRLEEIHFEGGVIWSGTELEQQLLDSAASDGNDEISTFDHATIVDGGAGDDLIHVLSPDARLLVKANGGDDLITVDRADGDIGDLVFEGMTPSDVVFRRVGMIDGIAGDHLVIETSKGASVTILHGLEQGGEFNTYPVGNLIFAGGEQYFFRADLGTLQGAGLAGSPGRDILGGLIDNDGEIGTYVGPTGQMARFEDGGETGEPEGPAIVFSQDDRFDGGAGDDIFIGNGGLDTVVFGYGSGSDLILSDAGAADEEWDGQYAVELGAGITFDDIAVAWSLEELGYVELSLIGSGDRLLFAPSDVIELRFADGTVAPVVLQSEEPTDFYIGNPGDTLSGTGANESFYSPQGGVTVQFGAESGFDSFFGSGIDNVVDFVGVAGRGDLFIRQRGEDLEVFVRETGAQLGIVGQLAASGPFVGELRFSDGSVLAAGLIVPDVVSDGSFAEQTGNPGDTLVGTGIDEDLVSLEGGVTFQVGADFGRDYIWDDSVSPEGETPAGWTPNRIVFDDIAGPGQLDFYRQGEALLVVNGNSGSIITIDGQYYLEGGVIAEFEFAGGTIYDWAAIAAMVGDFGSGEPAAPIVDLSQIDTPATEGDDTLLARTQAHIDGGAGDDTILLFGNDVEITFGAGSGNDRIQLAETSIGGATIVLSGVAGPEDVRILRGGDGLEDLVLVLETGERLVFAGAFAAGSVRGGLDLQPIVTALRFDDGSTIDWDEIEARIEGDDSDGDNLIGSGGDGGVLVGGAGADRLEGGAGDDIYVLDRAFDEDVLRDAGGRDRVQFGPGVELEDVYFSRTGAGGGDLLIEVLGQERLAMTVEGQFASASRRIELFMFSDGRTLDAEAVEQFILARAATGDADVIDAFATADSLAGEGGNDLLHGRGGDDRIDGGAGRDTAVYSGRRDQYDIVTEADGSVRVQDLIAGRDGTDRLTGVETLRFLGDAPGAGDLHLVPPNSAPTAPVLTIAGTEDQLVSVAIAALLAAASDADGDAVAFAGITDAEGGQAWVGLEGQIRFRPDPDFNGTASFTYAISDGNGGTTDARVEIEVAPVNDLPTAALDAGSALVIAEDEAEAEVAWVRGSDVDGDTLAYDIVTGNAGGLFVIDDTGRIATTRPASDGDVGIHNLEVEVSDGAGGTSTIGVAVTVTGINDAPVVNAPIADQLWETGQTISFTLPAGTFADADGDALELSATLDDDSGLPEWLAFDPATGLLSGTVPADAAGTLTIRITASDGRTVVSDDFLVTIQASGMGTPGDDVLEGNGLDNMLYGLGGNDILRGLGGNDLLDGGTGTDTMEGGAGNDVYIVDNSGDVVTETSGGGTGDEVRASLASYTLALNVERLTGTLATGQALTGNALANLLTGGAGADSFNGGLGSDTVSWAWSQAGISVDLQTGATGGEAAGDTFVSIENLTGGQGADMLSGTSAANILDGGAGADTMTGRGGNDIYYVDDAGDGVVELAGQGNDDVRTTLVALALAGNVEILRYVGAGNFEGAGNDLNNSLYGGAGNDELVGGAGYDTLIGGAGADQLFGGSEGDVLDGGAGADHMEGGDGSDNYLVDNAGDVVVEQSGEGVDLVYASAAEYALAANVENVTGQIGTGQHLVGNGLANLIWAGGGADTLEGGDGDDELRGNGGNDSIDGGDGADLVVGGSGIDALTGGAGADTFRFGGWDSTTGYADWITDFVSGVDKIDLAAVDAGFWTSGDQAFTFIGSDAFSWTAGELRYHSTGTNTYLKGDWDGDGAADLVIILSGEVVPLESDFIL